LGKIPKRTSQSDFESFKKVEVKVSSQRLLTDKQIDKLYKLVLEVFLIYRKKIWHIEFKSFELKTG